MDSCVIVNLDILNENCYKLMDPVHTNVMDMELVVENFKTISYPFEGR
jgi:hypothetical protein